MEPWFRSALLRCLTIRRDHRPMVHGFPRHPMANLMKFLEGLRNAPGATAPVLAASKHWDYILTSTNSQRPSWNVYERISASGTMGAEGWWRGPGWKDSEVHNGCDSGEACWRKARCTPTRLIRKSYIPKIRATMFVVFVANGAEGLDKYQRSTCGGARKSNPVGLAAYGTLIDSHGHRDTLARVTTMTSK